MTSTPPSPQRRAFIDTLFEALAAGSTVVRDAAPLQLLQRLVDDGHHAAGRRPIVELDALSEIGGAGDLDAGIDIATERFETPERFREALLFARCLERDPETTVGLRRARSYLADTIVPPAFPDVLTDQDALLRLIEFAAIWEAPERAVSLLSAFNSWKNRYAFTYVPQHAVYHAAVANIAERIDAAGARAAAVSRLNTLRRLGPAVAVAALAGRDELERLYPCSRSGSGLVEALNNAPVCPDCAYILGTEAPAREARRVLQAIERGLATQQARLARRVISRILALPAPGEDERIERFVRVVQASDLTGLALVLDDELIELIREMLEPAPSTEGVLAILAREYPEVTPANLDAVVAEFRRLLEAGLVAQGRPLRLTEGRS